MNTLKDFLKLSNGNELNIEYPVEIKDKDGNIVYSENSDGYWYKSEYDSKGNQTYSENSDGFWVKREFNSKGNQTYAENSNGYWFKREYDSNGNRTYYENSNWYWYKSEFDSEGNRTYYENSYGDKEGISKNPIKELTIEQIQNELGYKIKIVE